MRDGETIETARFFPDVTLNFADNLLSPAFSDGQTALISVSGERPAKRWTRAELRDAVERVAGSLRALGLRPGDHVGAIARNSDQAVIMALAATALGAVYAGTAVDMGMTAIGERLLRVAPRFLFIDESVRDDVSAQKMLDHLLPGLPDLQAVVALGGCQLVAPSPIALIGFDALMKGDRFQQAHWPKLPFNHPLFIMFSSGTTGPPKCIVHGAGGTLIEHVKEHRLHCDLQPQDILYFQTSCAWMMWNWQLSALASGAAIVLVDDLAGPLDAWRVAAEHKVTLLGTSPAFLRLTAAAGLPVDAAESLSQIRTLYSTGSPLAAEQFHWVWTHVAPDLCIQSISGGTDIIGCFMLGSPILPVRAGEIQCLSLGMDVRALGACKDVPIGELICANPFPSRPVGFLDDPDGTRFHRAYFSQNPGVWTHGDAIEMTSAGGVIVHGRSDGVLNLRGIRIGPSEIYRALFRSFPQITGAMAIDQRDPQAFPEGRLILLIVLQPGVELSPELSRDIRSVLGSELSSAHVPHLILPVDALPVTHSGKQSEAAMTDVINGRAARNMAALRNPDVLQAIVERVHAATASRSVDDDSAGCLSEHVARIWCEMLGVRSVSPDDDFFALGGDSLMAVTLMAAIHEKTAIDLPFATIFRASTLAELTAELTCYADQRTSARTVRYREGSGRPIFWIPGWHGSESFVAQLSACITVDRPLIAIEVGAYDTTPVRSVGQVAADYVSLIRSEQPHGPYTIGGWSMGGLLAYEVAVQLASSGEVVDTAYILDPYIHWRQRTVPQMLRYLGRGLRSRSAGEHIDWVRAKLRQKLSRHKSAPVTEALLASVRPDWLDAWAAYRPAPYHGHILLALPAEPSPLSCPELWDEVASHALQRIVVPGGHFDMTADTLWLARLIDQFSLTPTVAAETADQPLIPALS